jgi:DNA-binding response OmpR family regulator
MDTKATHVDGTTVLVVDDNPDVREILSRNLERVGYRVIAASGGQECLDIVRSQPVDVILLDVMMPGMDGLTACEELKKIDRGATIPVILVTAKDDVDTRAAGMRLGVSEYITKPVNMNELHTRLQSQLHAREIRRKLDDASRKLGTLTSDEVAEQE